MAGKGVAQSQHHTAKTKKTLNQFTHLMRKANALCSFFSMSQKNFGFSLEMSKIIDGFALHLCAPLDGSDANYAKRNYI